MNTTDRVTESIESFNAYELAHMADCASPDTLESPGAVFLLRVASDVAERWEEMADQPQGDPNYSGTVSEIADSAVPIYNAERWATFTDLWAWEENPSELGYDATTDMTQLAAVCLYVIAERLVYGLIEAVREDTEDGDED